MYVCYLCEETIAVVGGTSYQPLRREIDSAMKLVHPDCHDKYLDEGEEQQVWTK